MSSNKLAVGNYSYEFDQEDKHFKNGFWFREGDNSFFIRFSELEDFEEVVTRALKKAKEVNKK